MKSRIRMSKQSPSSVFVCIALAVVLGGSSLTHAADWPNYRGSNYDGISSETGWQSTWQKAPEIPWKASLGWGFASMAVTKGCVYTMGNVDDNDIVYCFDADSGKELWRQSYPCPLYKKNHEGGPAATPTVAGDGVYVFSKNGDALRLDAKTGGVVWHKNLTKELGLENLTWYYSGSPLVAGDVVILNAGTAGVGLNKADGKVIWQNGKGAAGYATPVPATIGGQKCVVLFTRDEILGVVADSGKILWRHKWKTKYDVNSADPIPFGDTVFISSGYNKGCCLVKVTGAKCEELWNNKNMRNHFNCSVLWKGHLYGFDESTLACLDFETGQTKWAQRGLGKGSLMLADGKLIILSERGKLVIADASPEEFKELASAQILEGKCWTVPVLANGRIYARNAAGALVCVDVRRGK
jgi:outer membrane protein assembly factor BamB